MICVLGDQINKNGMDGECNTYGAGKNGMDWECNNYGAGKNGMAWEYNTYGGREEWDVLGM